MSDALTRLGCPQGTARIQGAEPPPRGALEKKILSVGERAGGGPCKWVCRVSRKELALKLASRTNSVSILVPFRGRSGSILDANREPFWSEFGDFWGVRGCGHPSGVLFAPLWLPFRPQGSHLGSVLDPLAPIWPPFWTKWLHFGSPFGSRAPILAPFGRLFA